MEVVKQRLRAFGYRTRDTKTGFLVTVPMFTSVDVSMSGGELRARARYGILPRGAAVAGLFGISFLVPLMFVIPGFVDTTSWLPEAASWVRYALVLTAIWEVLRFIVAESMIIRIELLATLGARPQ